MNKTEATVVQQFLGQLLIEHHHRAIAEILVKDQPNAAGGHNVIVMEQGPRIGLVQPHNLASLGDVARYLFRLFPT